MAEQEQPQEVEEVVEDKKAKKEKKKTKDKKPKKHKGKKKWIFLLILVLAAGGAGYYFREPLLEALRNVPVIGEFIPESDTQEEEKGPTTEELNAQVTTQEKEIERLTKTITALQQSNDELTARNEELQEYETNYNNFVSQKAAWDEDVARTNPDLFIEQFETFYPDVAERIYQTLKGDQIVTDEQKKLSASIGQMDEGAAAEALELLISTDPDLIQLIFEGMGTDRKAAILGSMTPEGAAAVIKLISPDA